MNQAERFLTSIGWDYKNTESAARIVAEEAQNRIDEQHEALTKIIELTKGLHGMPEMSKIWELAQIATHKANQQQSPIK